MKAEIGEDKQRSRLSRPGNTGSLARKKSAFRLQFETLFREKPLRRYQ
jgi:hypothetical protein